MDDGLVSLFGFVCGRDPDHLWAPGGLVLPCCQRCVGLYVGAVLGVVLNALFRPRSTPAWRWLHGLFLLQMVPFGFHWIPQGPGVRTMTGLLFACGLVAFLWPVAVAAAKSFGRRRWPEAMGTGRCGSEGLRFGTSDAILGRSCGGGTHPGYALGLILGCSLVLAAAQWGGPTAGRVLTFFVTVGALLLASLAFIHVGSLLVGALGPPRLPKARVEA